VPCGTLLESAKWFYSELEIYSDENKDRITSFMKTKILLDTITVDAAFSYSLEGMLGVMEVNKEEVDLEVFVSDDEEFSAMFTFKINNKKVNGFGFMFLQNRSLESIWLMPLKRGFTKDYIEEFADGIIPDY
jgi:hypothetical protein